MAVAVMVDIPGGTEQQYAQIIARVFPEGKLPEGWLVHIAGPTENGWRIVNVVPSQEQFEAFAREQLRPTLQQVGEGDVTPQLTFFPVHRLIRNERSCYVRSTAPQRIRTGPGSIVMSGLATQPARASGEFAIGGDLLVVRLGFGTMSLSDGRRQASGGAGSTWSGRATSPPTSPSRPCTSVKTA